MDTSKKYSNPHAFAYAKRSWPDKEITQAPLWCSVDLRDGNQALINPMDLQKKLKFFKVLCELGFKEIEVGFPSAAQVEYDFVRKLIEEDLIPDDVTIQVLTQARKELIARTMDAIKDAKRAIVHLYNSTSIDQRDIVFRKNKAEIIAIATQGVKWIKEHITKEHGTLVLEYSPESFTGTEVDFALSICEAAFSTWHEGASPSNEKVIINLPATVELYGPHRFADRIEWFADNFSSREDIILSLHTHNDRGTGIAATELGLLAGGDRVEGTLFGNGERTGNVDIITLALNLYTHGIDPKLAVKDVPRLVKISDECTEIPLSKRHPYAGELVFTAFSGSHQDAINKGLAYQRDHKLKNWRVPYLPLDPDDIGRTYKAIIRINSQSGKGGLSYIMQQEFGYLLPKQMQVEFSKYVQTHSEGTMAEVKPETVRSLFESTYLNQKNPYLKYIKVRPQYIDDTKVQCELTIAKRSRPKSDHYETATYTGTGNGPIDAAKIALEQLIGKFELLDYHEHSLGRGSDATAIAYVEVKCGDRTHFGAGVDPNITAASLKALVSALNFFHDKTS
ncbi:2-isopropylmalate synthase [Spirochaetota bacterium]|nr:2-isopropylmalate synthase [Spirochaetota bacterium]